MPQRTAIILFLVLIGLAAAVIGTFNLMNARTFQLFGDLVPRVETAEKVVALTFDDGPTEKTSEILKILAEAGIKATFFVNGNQIARYPAETRQIVAAGHELGNHTYSHQRMVFKTPSFIRWEIEETDRLIRASGYLGEIHFRPPFGKKLVGLPYYLAKHGRKTIMWDVEPDSDPEIAQNRDAIVQHVADNAKPGSIILLHVWYGSREESLAAVKGIASALKQQGYRFVTVSELLHHQGR